MADLNLNFEFNAQKLHRVKVAATLWADELIKKEIQDFANNVYNFEEDGVERERKWWHAKIHNKVIDQMQSKDIPVEDREEIKQTVILMGQNVYSWMVYIMLELRDPKFLNSICWTEHGQIDENKTYWSWKEDFTVACYLMHEDYMFRKMFFFFFACVQLDLEFVEGNFKDVIKLAVGCLKFKMENLCNLNTNGAFTILLCYYFSLNDNVEFQDVYSKVKSSKYSAYQMFLNCVSHKLVKPAEYFYEKLKNKDKQGVLQKAAEDLVSFKGMKHGGSMIPTQKMLIDLLKKMATESREKFLLNNITRVHSIFAYSWPYVELCIPILNSIWNDLKEQDKKVVIVMTIEAVCHHSDVYPYLEAMRGYYNEILQNLLSKISLDEKVDLFQDSPLIYKLFKISEFSMIRSIINDVEGMRLELIDISDYLEDYLKEGGSIKNIKNYMVQLEFSNDERETFLRFCKDPAMLKKLKKGLNDAEMECE